MTSKHRAANRRTSARAGAAALAGVLGIAVAVATATGASASPSSGSALHVPDWAGYWAAPTPGLASASTVFTIPSIDCSAGSGEGENIGLWGGTGQPGDASHFETAAVELSCNGTSPVYMFYVQAKQFHFTEVGANPGDTVVASFYQTGTWDQATVHDLTSQYTWIANAVADPSTTSPTAAIGVSEYPVTSPALVPFDSVKFTQNEVNGDFVNFQSPSEAAWYRGTTLLATPGPLEDNTSFRVRFENS